MSLSFLLHELPCGSNLTPVVWSWCLRKFARKFSNIDFFLKILPLKDDELVMSEMLKKLGVIDFVLERTCPEEHLNLSKSSFVSKGGHKIL